ncbi:hypothetical protein I4U23_028422 [Adineta vaga]|nr:hypothetical protein I4U23_028422 [Adineta vaga]
MSGTSKETCERRRIDIQRIQNVLLIWLDANIDANNEDSQNKIAQLRRVVNDVNIYTDGDECFEFIETIEDRKACMIISGSLVQHIAPCVHDLSQVNSIFILCDNKQQHEGWVRQWPKIQGVFTEIEPICVALKQAAQRCEQNAVSISFVASGKNNEKDLPLCYAQSAATNPDLMGIFFVMIIDPKQSKTAFASIRGLSAIPGEDEVLFSMNSVFRIHSINQMDENNKLFEVILKLTGDNDQDLGALTSYIREESFPDAEGWVRLGLVLIQLGQTKKAEEIYKMILDQTTNEDAKATIYHQIGRIKDCQGEYEESIRLTSRAQEL